MSDEEKKFKQGKNPNSLKNLVPIKPGQVLNPFGSQDKGKRKLHNVSNAVVRDVIDAALSGNLEALKAISEDPDAPALKVGVARALFNAIKSGDWGTLERIVEKITGKTPIIVEQTIDDKRPRVVINIPSNGREVIKDAK